MSASVLLVDDDQAFRQLARRMLVAAGLTVVAEAATVAEAMSAAREWRPDCVLVDVGLPDGDGISLAGALTALSHPPRVLLTSSDSDAVSAADLSRCGAVGFVPKGNLPSVPLRRLLDGR
jgi:DNA-binding NarL/FixJ family response regulator